MAGLIIVACIFFPRELFSICGVSLEKRPELYPHMLSYLKGYMIGIPAMMAINVFYHPAFIPADAFSEKEYIF